MFEALTGSRVGKIRHRTRCRGREQGDHLPFRDDPASPRQGDGVLPDGAQGAVVTLPGPGASFCREKPSYGDGLRRKTLKVPDKSFTHAGGEVAEWSKARPC